MQTAAPPKKRKRKAPPPSRQPRRSRKRSQPMDSAAAGSAVPSITVQHDSANESESLAERSLNTATSSENLTTSSNSPPSAQKGLDSDVAVIHPEGARIIDPFSIKYRLSVTFFSFEESKDFDLDHDLTVSLHDQDSYNALETKAQRYVREVFAGELDSREPSFRYGNCKIIGDKNYECRRPLRSQEDWEKICRIIINHGQPRLEIWRQYFGCQNRAYDKKSLTAAKVDELVELVDYISNETDGRPYVGRADLDRIIPHHTIANIINESFWQGTNETKKASLIRTVQSKAPVLLAMSLYVGLSAKCFQKLIENGVDDSKLPLTKNDRCHGGKRFDCTARFNTLIEKQPCFRAARFEKIGDHQSLTRDIVVPIHFCPVRREGEFAKDRAFCGSGTFSMVYRVRLGPNQHELKKDKDAYFALKEFKHRQKVTSDFEKEVKVLNELRRYRHDNIVTHLATWTQDGTYYMLFPYAECNLLEYMEQYGLEMHKSENNLWLLKQIHGLGSALKRIHDLTDEEPSSSSMLQPPSPSLQGERKSGWHHDLKPENILFFGDTDLQSASFRISDWGSGKVNTYRSGSNKTESASGTLTYEPPELLIDGNTSRPHDVWSLGCVFLELLVWALHGFKTVENFKKNRHGKRDVSSKTNFKDNAFWQKNENGVAVLRKSVNLCMQDLEEQISKQKLIGLEPVLDLVRKMLNTHRASRIEALHVKDTLEKICDQTEIDLENLRSSAADRSDPSIRLSTKAPEPHSPDHGPFGTSSTSRQVASPHIRRSHSRNTSELAPSDASQRARSISNASSTLSHRYERQGAADGYPPGEEGV